MGDILNKTLRNIEQIRSNKGFTQEYVASKVGLKQSGYALIMRGERGLQFELLEKIAIFYGMDITDIINYPDRYEKVGSQTSITRVLVELDVSDDELIKMD